MFVPLPKLRVNPSCSARPGSLQPGAAEADCSPAEFLLLISGAAAAPAVVPHSCQAVFPGLLSLPEPNRWGVREGA